jgi:hypothetical protein
MHADVRRRRRRRDPKARFRPMRQTSPSRRRPTRPSRPSRTSSSVRARRSSRARQWPCSCWRSALRRQADRLVVGGGHTADLRARRRSAPARPGEGRRGNAGRRSAPGRHPFADAFGAAATISSAYHRRPI